MPVENITPTKPVRGGDGYMGTCPECGKRKRLNQGLGDRVYRGVTYKTVMWFFWCACGYKERVGTDREIKARLAGPSIPARRLCTVCREREAVWARQYIGSDSPEYYRLGYHIRGFPVVKLCEECKCKE